MNDTNDMCAGKVQLDLAKMVQVCAGAIAAHRQLMERYSSIIRDDLYEGEIEKDPYKKYLARCHAHSNQEYLLEETRRYCAAVDQYFYLTEAVVGEELTVIRNGKVVDNA